MASAIPAADGKSLDRPLYHGTAQGTRLTIFHTLEKQLLLPVQPKGDCKSPSCRIPMFALDQDDGALERDR